MPRPAKPPRLILRRQPGRGRIWVIIDRGKETSTGCSEADFAKAEAKLGAYITGKHTLPSKVGALSKLAIADIVNIYLIEHAPTKPKSLSFIKATAAPIIDWWGDKTLADVNAKACIDYVLWRSKAVSDQTARHDLKTLRAAINYYHANHGPLDAVPIVTLPARTSGRIRWLTRSEMARLLWASRRYEHVKRLVLIGRYTGTRPGAILSLCWMENTLGGWIDVDAGVIHRRGVREAETKKRKPPAKIHRRLVWFLRKWRERDLANNVAAVCHWQGAPIEKLRRSWATVRSHAGLDEEVTPHVLRHTRVTWLLQEGVAIFEVAGSVGMSPETVERVYGHHHPDFQSQAANSR